MFLLLLLLLAGPALWAGTGSNILLVVNQNDPVSRQIGDYYRPRRSVPPQNVCRITPPNQEEISWEVYLEQVEKPIAACLQKNGLDERVLYIVTTLGVPLKVTGGGLRMTAEYASVDSELTLLYGKTHGLRYARAGGIPNPLFMKRDADFQHPQFPIYLVTRLAAYDWTDVKAMIDRSLAARNRGKFVIDSGQGEGEGNNWLRTAAMLLPRNRLVLDTTAAVLYGKKDVIGYASWGSNDGERKRRWLGFEWLPGAIATEYVSTNGRTFQRPPDNWTFTSWEDRAHFFGGSPQGLSADFIHEGATGASGNTYEPYLGGCARPDYLLPAYYRGRNLAESYYIALPFLSWQSIVLGDPLCSLGKP